MTTLPWYAVTISPLRVLALCGISAVWLWLLFTWVATFTLGAPEAAFGDVVGGLGAFVFLGQVASVIAGALTLLVAVRAVLDAIDRSNANLNPSITIGKPRPPKPPKAVAREVECA